MTIDNGAYVTAARPSIFAGWPGRRPNQRYTQTVWGSRLHREGSFPETLVWRPLIIWLFVASITDDSIFGLGILHTYDASLCTRPFQPGVDNNPFIPVQYEGVVISQLESPSAWKMAWYNRVRRPPLPKDYIARTLF